jgi:formylglycine-generating enzyme required for sulfatase activity
MGNPPPPSFWQSHGEAILVSVITAILILLFSEPIKVIIEKISRWVDNSLSSRGMGFKKRYLRAIANEHRWLRLIGVPYHSPHPPRLRSVFTSLFLNKALDTKTQKLKWDEVFSQEQKHIVLTGQPGAGKTTLLDYLVLIFSGEIVHSLTTQIGALIPVYVRLRDISDTLSLHDLIITPNFIKNTPKGYFERLLGKGKCFVLMDGFDEVLDEKTQKSTVTQIRQFVNTYPNNYILVTCRLAGWKNQLPDFSVYEVQQFDDENIFAFIREWYKEVLYSKEISSLGFNLLSSQKAAIENKVLAEANLQTMELINALHQSNDLLRVARNPLILSIITFLRYVGALELPKSRSWLYQRCLEILLLELDIQDKDLVIENVPPLEDKLLVLKVIAFIFLEKGILELDTRYLEELVQSILPFLKKGTITSALLQNIYERSGVLIKQSFSSYGFAHRAFQDYLAASYIVDTQKDELLIQHVSDEAWHEVILISIGLIKSSERTEKVLEALMNSNQLNGITLAGWSLGENVLIHAKLREEIRIKLLGQLAETQQPNEFMSLSGALIANDFDTALAWMKDVFISQDKILRSRILIFMKTIGTEHSKIFLPMLSLLLGDKRLPIISKARVAYTLAQVGAPIDQKIKDALNYARQAEEPLRSLATLALCELGYYTELGLIKVPEGEFIMGSHPQRDEDVRDNEQPQHRIHIPTFYISKHPVTVFEWKHFISTSGYQPKNMSSLAGRLDRPVSYVTWDEALIYAKWFGMTLPSEAEWEKAARGIDGRIYPWGNTWNGSLANTSESSIYRKWLSLGIGRKAFYTRVGYFSPKGDSPFGCSDMAGNVWEWTRSISKEYPYNPIDGRENMNNRNNTIRILRGGSFVNNRETVRCAFRGGSEPNYYDKNIGFRIAVSSTILDLESL